MDTPFTLRDVLQRKVFQRAEVVAGANGLHRRVTWVHILEAAEIRSFIRGGELVLTTGSGFGRLTESFVNYVQQLISAKASGLCIELGTVISALPDAVIDLANANDFPILTFAQIVRFVDITQDIHAFILSRHHKLLDDLEGISRKLQQFTLHAACAEQVVETMHEVTGCPVLYQRSTHSPLLAPIAKNEVTAAWSTQLNSFSKANSAVAQVTVVPLTAENVQYHPTAQVMVIQPTMVLGSQRGLLSLVSPAEQVDEYLYLLVDKAANALAQDEFRRLSLQERQLFRDQEWAMRVIRPQLGHRLAPAPSDAVEGGTSIVPGAQKDARYAVVVMDAPLRALLPRRHQTPSNTNRGTHVPADEFWLEERAELSMMLRLAFQSSSLLPYIAVQPSEIVLIVKHHQSDEKFRTVLESVIVRLRRTWQEARLQSDVHIGVGSSQLLANIPRSYEEAEQAREISCRLQQKDLLFYTECGMLRFIPALERDAQAMAMSRQELQALVEHDIARQTNLLHTLKTYLDCERAVKQTADKLFIHRQTLYHRLQQIQSLLDVDLEDPVQRLSLHIAVHLFTLLPGLNQM